MHSPLKRGAGPLAWSRGDTRIAYVVKVVRYVGRSVAHRGGTVAERFIGGSLPQR